MATSPIDVPGEDEEAVEEPEGVRELVRRSFITGTAIILPLAVTLMIVGFVVNFISNNLDPLATVVQGLPFVAAETSPDAIKLVSVVGLLSVVFVLGFVAEFSKRGVEFSEAFDEFMASLPGIGSVYTSFDEMSDILLDSDTESFQDVKLVEYPGEDSYTVAFKTAETPPRHRIEHRQRGHGDALHADGPEPRHGRVRDPRLEGARRRRGHDGRRGHPLDRHLGGGHRRGFAGDARVDAQ